MRYIIRSVIPVTGFRAVFKSNDGSFFERDIVALGVADQCETNSHGRAEIDSTFGRDIVGLQTSDCGIVVCEEACNFVCLLGPLDDFSPVDECPVSRTPIKTYQRPEATNA